MKERLLATDAVSSPDTPKSAAEKNQLDITLQSEQKVGTLNVSVNFPLRMQVVEPLQCLPANIGNLPFFQGPSGVVNLLQ